MRAPRTFPVVLAGFTAFLDLYATQPLLPLLARTFHATNFAVSLTVTAPTIAVGLAAPAVGRLGDALGRRRVIVASAFALALSTLLAATAATLPQLVAWRFVQGLVTPGVFAVTIAYIHESWPSSRVGTVTAAYVTGTVVGGFAGRVVAGLMAADVNWEMSFAALGALILAATMALWWLLPAERVAAPAPAESRAGSLAAHLRNGPLVATCAVGFGVLFTLVALFTYVTFLLAAPPYRLSTAALGWLFVVYLVGALVTPFSGRWIDEYGHRTALTVAVVLGVAGALLSLLHPLGWIVAGLAVACTGVFIAQAAATSHVGEVAGHNRGLAVGLYALFYYAGGSVGAALPSAVWSAGGWPACVALVIVVQAATIAIATVFW